MASQSFIIEQENKVIAAVAAIKEAREALAVEILANSYMNDSRGCYRENQDCWATLAINVKLLLNECERFLKP